MEGVKEMKGENGKGENSRKREGAGDRNGGK